MNDHFHVIICFIPKAKIAQYPFIEKVACALEFVWMQCVLRFLKKKIPKSIPCHKILKAECCMATAPRLMAFLIALLQ